MGSVNGPIVRPVVGPILVAILIPVVSLGLKTISIVAPNVAARAILFPVGIPRTVVLPVDRSFGTVLTEIGPLERTMRGYDFGLILQAVGNPQQENENDHIKKDRNQHKKAENNQLNWFTHALVPQWC